MKSSNHVRKEDRRSAFPWSLARQRQDLRFGIDALLLAAFASKALAARPALKRNGPLRLVELGCGDGAALLGILLDWPEAIGLGIDVNADLIASARINGKRLELARAHFETLNLRQLGSWKDLGSWEQKAGLVLANPPWRLSSEDRRSASKARNLAFWAEADSFMLFAAAAASLLKHGGQFCSIIDPASLPAWTREMEKHRLGLREIFPLAPREGMPASRLLLLGQKNARALPRLLAPLVLHDAFYEGSRIWSKAALDFCPWLGAEKPTEETERVQE